VSGYVAWPVKIKEPKRRAHLRRPLVAYPYTGPTLWDIYVDITELVHVVPELSNLEYSGVCPACGREKFDVTTDDEGEQYFVVDRSTWHGQDFMLPEEVNGMFVTERVAEVIKRGGFTNIEVRPIGRISD